jgi:chromosome segregation protein
VYVKSLTMKGFKSFASATHLRLEPGITCIVGPNGSGKSNVVDALAWVMGEQGAKSLRGGSMEDVIFAGTSGRPPLGRAEVALTIDNTDGALPIDYTEVTISRTMFRSGGSEYAINGTSCRLLDIQELLSDSGIGREMHVIVGQGQLDAVLRATPEERRGFIEEAAGVLKHRKRKERALRKLEAMEANLTRISDLTGEIRRQLGPLGRQAETARKAAAIQAEVRDARLRLLADDLIQLTSTLEQEVADETALIARRTDVEAGLTRLGGRVGELEAAAEAARPELTRAQDRWYALARLTERLTATGSLASERVRLLREDLADEARDAGSGASSRDPEELRRQAADLLAQHEALVVEIADATAALAVAVAARSEVEQAYASEQQRLARVARAVADRREGLARLAGQVAAKASRIEAAEGELGRMRDTVEAARSRAAQAEREFAVLESSIAAEEAGEEDLDAGYEQAAADLDRLEAELEELREQERVAERDRQSAAARVEALELSLRRKDGAAALLAAADGTHTISGSVASLLQVEAGHEVAVAAALGWAGDALAVDTLVGAAAAVGRLRSDDAGRAGLLVPETAGVVDRSEWPALPSGARWALEVVSCSERLRPAVDRLLERVALVDGVDAAASLARDGVTAVTVDGDVFGPGWVRGGSAAAPSLIEIQAAVDEAGERVGEASGRAERTRFAMAALRTRVAEASDTVESALDQLHDSDAKMSAVAEKLGALGVAVRSARAEAERTERGIAAAEAAVAADRAEHVSLAERYEAAVAQTGVSEEHDGDAGAEPSTDERDRLDAEATRARAHETELRLALRTREERGRALHDRATALEAAAVAEIEARVRHEARRQRRLREAEVAEAVRVGAAYAAKVVARAAEQADALRRRAEETRTARDAELTVLRRDVAVLQDELRELTDSVHRDEVARTQQRLRIEQLETRAIEELGVDPATLVEEFGPHRPVAQPPPEGSDEPGEPQAYVRETQEKRLRGGERRLAALGRINPLALEEFTALEERHTFLTTQLEDLKRSKRDLLDIIREVDERIERVFTEAYHDVAVQFERVFSRLFPGGEGRLVLTDPDNMLTTGLDVEARPPGKKIKRLSLLSGGERSLVAVALLVSIFTARPSPFYILDEVEAALDDANLGRLILLLEELRDSSQLIVITHQKRTMEIADALYGVTMRGDGVSTVVSQRMSEVAGARSA